MEAGVAREYFREGAVNKKVNRKIFCGFLILFNYFEYFSAEEIFHDVVKLGVVDFFNSGKTFGEYFSVASVGAEDKIVYSEKIRLTDGGSFLPH